MVEELSSPGHLAQRLLAHEAGDIPDSGDLAGAADRIFKKLHTQLSTYVGSKGYGAILREALRTAQATLPSLRGLESYPDEEQLSAFSETLTGLNRIQAAEAVMSLLRSFIGVLTDLLGWDFTCRLVSTAWAELTFIEECSNQKP